MNVFKRYLYFRKILHQSKEYLAPGFFYFNRRNISSFFSDRKALLFFPYGPIPLRTKLLASLLSLFPFWVKKRGAGTTFSASAVYFNNSASLPSDFKFFDFDKGLLLTKYSSADRFASVRRSYEEAIRIFPAPSKSFCDASNSVLETISESFGAMNRDCLPAFLALMNFYANRVFVPENLAGEDLYLQHGDLSFSNFSYDQKTGALLFIDFDHFGAYPPFYDLLFLVYNNYVYRSSQLLEKLDSGCFDSLFGRWGLIPCLEMFAVAISKRTRAYDELICSSVEAAKKRIAHSGTNAFSPETNV